MVVITVLNVLLKKAAGEQEAHTFNVKLKIVT